MVQKKLLLLIPLSGIAVSELVVSCNKYFLWAYCVRTKFDGLYHDSVCFQRLLWIILEPLRFLILGNDPVIMAGTLSIRPLLKETLTLKTDVQM